MTECAVEELVAKADRLHKQAQALNREGKYDEGKLVYQQYLKADADAMELSICCADLPDHDPFMYPTLAPLPLPPGDPAGMCAVGAVLGSFVGDAAAMGVHWVYDPSVLEDMQLKASQQGKAGLDFFDPPANVYVNSCPELHHH